MTDLSINIQPKFAWQARLINNVYYQVEKGKQPNWFHRKMQKFCFGIEWSRLK
jgi:hypothetical protein